MSISLGLLTIIAIVLFAIGLIITFFLYEHDKLDTWEIGAGISVVVCFLPLILCLLELVPDADGVNIEKEVLEENVYDITSVESLNGYDCIYIYHTGSEVALRYPYSFLGMTDGFDGKRILVRNDDYFSDEIVIRREETTYSNEILGVTVSRKDTTTTIYIYTVDNIVEKYEDSTVLWESEE